MFYFSHSQALNSRNLEVKVSIYKSGFVLGPGISWPGSPLSQFNYRNSVVKKVASKQLFSTCFYNFSLVLFANIANNMSALN